VLRQPGVDFIDRTMDGLPPGMTPEMYAQLMAQMAAQPAEEVGPVSSLFSMPIVDVLT